MKITTVESAPTPSNYNHFQDANRSLKAEIVTRIEHLRNLNFSLENLDDDFESYLKFLQQNTNTGDFDPDVCSNLSMDMKFGFFKFQRAEIVFETLSKLVETISNEIDLSDDEQIKVFVQNVPEIIGKTKDLLTSTTMCYRSMHLRPDERRQIEETIDCHDINIDHCTKNLSIIIIKIVKQTIDLLNQGRPTRVAP
jgi:hypothetical protein